LDPVDLAELMERTDVRSSKVGKQLAGQALEDNSILGLVAGYLESPEKAKRAAAAETFAEACKKEPRVGVPYVSDIIGALGNTEPQTRWEGLLALSFLSSEVPDEVEAAIPVIVRNLHDPKSMIVRSSAAVCLGRLGSTGTDRALAVLPHLEDALVKYGGGNELGSILDAMTFIAEGMDDVGVKGALAELVAPYADHQRSSIAKRVRRLQGIL
jgi:hypothetical protein